MVSLSRLLAAAVETPPELQAAAAQSLPPTRDCVLPPALPPDAVPPRLRAALGTQTATTPQSANNPNPSTATPGAASSAPPSYSRLANPPLPLQRLLEDLGPEATASRNMASLVRTLVHFGRPSEAAVASALLFLATAEPPPESAAVDSHIMFHLFAMFCADPESPALDSAVQRAVASVTPSPTEWRVDVLVQAVVSVAAQFNAPLDWRLVIRSLDVDGLEKQLNQSAFVEIAKAHMTGTGGSLVPGDVILGDWMHAPSQICMISHALASPKYVNWDTLEAFEGATAEDAVSPFARINLVEKLIELDARDLLQFALRQDPNLVLLSLTCSKPRRNASLQHKLTVTLLSPLIAAYPKSEKTLRQMWHVTPTLVESGLVSMWKKDPVMSRLAFMIAVDLNFLKDLLRAGNSAEFSLELAMLAFKEGLVNLETWLTDLLTARGLTVASTITAHLATKLRIDEGLEAAQMPLDAVRVIFRCLVNVLRGDSGNPQTQEVLDGFQELVQAYARLNPRLTDLSPSLDVRDPTVLVGTEVPENVAGGDRSLPEITSSLPPETSEGISEAASTAAALLLPSPLASNRVPAGFPSSIEKEASSYFENLYMRNLPTEHAVDLLRNYKLSNTDHNRRVFLCAMHTLFDEYRFFKKYPDRELEITGRLFGSIVNESLLEGELQGLALRCVLDALKTTEPSPHPIGRLATFGLYALERYLSRLREWPQYCGQILKLPRLAEVKPSIVEEAKRAFEVYRGPVPSEVERAIGLGVYDAEPTNEQVFAADGAAPPVTSVRDPAADADAVRALVSSPPPSGDNTPMKEPLTSSSAIRPSPSMTMNMDGSLSISALNLTTLLGVTAEEANQIVAPDDAVQDKIKFIFNNLSDATMDDKVKEILALLDVEYMRFFSVYIVVKRASSESNFHRLYLAMLEKMDPEAPPLFPMVFDTTYKRVRVLLASDGIVTIPGERMVLKSLGSWIGALTLARNQPILRRDLDLKELLMDAYSRGRLIAVVPFVAKVLEASRGSRIFKTTNPWIRGILSLMKEIYCVVDLKLNMKFELQLLCKSLNLDVNEVDASELLRDRPAPDKNNNPDFNTKKAASASPLRSSPSPATSPSPELRRAYAQAGASGRAGIPVFSLADAQSSTTTLPSIPVSMGPAPSTGRLDVGNNLISSNLSMGPDSVGDLSSMLASASLTSGNLSANQMQRSPLHAGTGLSSSAVPSSGPTQRQTSGLSASDSTLLPDLARYITISPSLLLFQQNPSLKRLLPLAIDRAIREIIQPVVERSCAIAFLTTKELTLKDFANEPDLGKVRRAALQMVQQLAGSLALVTSKEPLRVSMGNQLRSLLSPAVVGDQSLVEQTSQVICAANLEVGCAVIERHAKEKAARDLNEKIAPAFAARRPQHSSYNLGMTPGPEVLRVYDEFSRIPRLGAVPPQYAGAQQVSVSTSQPVRQVQTVNPPPQSTGLSAIRPVNGNAAVSAVPDHRANGSLADVQYSDVRAGNSRAPVRATAAPSLHPELQGQSVTVGRRASSVPSSSAEPRASTYVYGTSLPVMASSSELAAALNAAAGSSNASGLQNAAGTHATGSQANSASGEEEPLSTQQVLERFNAIYPQLTADISDIVSSSGSRDVALVDVPADHDIHSLWVQIPSAVKRSVTADEAGMAVAQKVFKHLYEGDSSLYREVHVLLLEGLRESCRRLSKELVSWLAYSEERRKLHKECIVALLKPGSLLNITNYDELLAKTIDNGRNVAALEFACFLVQRAVIDEPLATAAELYLTLEAISKVGRRASPPTLTTAPGGLIALVEASRNVVHQQAASTSTTAGGNEAHVSASRQQHQHQQQKEMTPADPAGTREAVAMCLVDWQRILASDSSHRPVAEHVVVSFLGHVRANFLSSDDTRERFIRVAVELVRSVTASALRSPASGAPGELASAPYTAVDAAVRLISALSRPEPSNVPDNTSRGVQILTQFVTALVKDILKNSTGADLRPHFRIFSGLIAELAIGVSVTDVTATGNGVGLESESVVVTSDWGLRELVDKMEAVQFLEDKNSGLLTIVQNAGMAAPHEKDCNIGNFQVLSVLVAALSACSPLVVPGFAFSWLQLMSNKEVLPRLLMSATTHGGNMFLHLLVSMLKFLSRHLKDPHESFTEGIRVLYKGTLRVLLVLLHDFPEFLCDYHMAIVDVIPHNCVQLRNIVLASFPKSMRLPDPFLPELKVDQLPEMSSQPRILTDYKKYLDGSGLRAVLDNYLHDHGFRRGSTPPLLQHYLVATDDETGERKYSIPAIGAFVLYVGQYAISRLLPGAPTMMEGPVPELIQSLTRELDPEGQYHLFNAIANQLRYPNCHTLYYSRLVLCLFHGSNEDSVKEQITRVLLERLIANRPHPWGLLVTFVELVKNSMYNFWGHEFVRCAPEIEELFENVAKVCIGPVMQNQHHSLATAS